MLPPAAKLHERPRSMIVAAPALAALALAGGRLGAVLSPALGPSPG